MFLKAFSFLAENNGSLDISDQFKPSPLPRSMVRKQSHRDEKDELLEDQEAALGEESKTPDAPLPLPRLNGRLLEAEGNSYSENFDTEVSTMQLLGSKYAREYGHAWVVHLW